MLIAICSSISDQIIEEAVKCNRENDAVLLANTILVYIGVLKVVSINCRYFDDTILSSFTCIYQFLTSISQIVFLLPNKHGCKDFLDDQ